MMIVRSNHRALFFLKSFYFAMLYHIIETPTLILSDIFSQSAASAYDVPQP